MRKLFPIAVIGMMCVSTVLPQTNVLEQGSTVGFRINADRSGTVQNAFTTALSAAGFKNVNNNSDYNLDVTITITLKIGDSHLFGAVRNLKENTMYALACKKMLSNATYY
jgi:hypothetical protein